MNNVREVDLLLMHNKTFTAEIAHNVSSRNRVIILERYVCRQSDHTVSYVPTGLRFWASRSPTRRPVCGQRSRVSFTFQHFPICNITYAVYAHAPCFRPSELSTTSYLLHLDGTQNYIHSHFRSCSVSVSISGRDYYFSMSLGCRPNNR